MYRKLFTGMICLMLLEPSLSKWVGLTWPIRNDCDNQPTHSVPGKFFRGHLRIQAAGFQRSHPRRHLQC